MKIITYNIWNDPAGMPLRLDHIEEEIRTIGADIVCLQEVGNIEIHSRLSASCGYAYSHFQAQTGLSVMSRYPFIKLWDHRFSAGAEITVSGKAVAVINVHLPWNSVLEREKAIVDIAAKADEIHTEYTLIMGDFNSSDNSSVHQFLKNDRSLFEKEAYYFDLAEVYAEITGTKPPSTLNFRENPRWNAVQSKNTIEVNQRFDRIMLKNPYPHELPLLKDCEIFGTNVFAETSLSASDHYGVYAEIQF